MIMSESEVDVFNVNGQTVFQTDEGLFFPVEERTKYELFPGDTFIDNGRVYTVLEKNHREYGDQNISLVLTEGSTKQGRYMGADLEIHASTVVEVTVIEEAEEMETSKTIKCRGCSLSWSWSSNGYDYMQKARDHVSNIHLLDGELDKRAIDGLLEVTG